MSSGGGGSVDLEDAAASSTSALARYAKLRGLGKSGDSESAAASKRHQQQNGDDRDKTPTARLATPPPAAESNTAQSTISRLENKYADILNKIARRKRQELQGGSDDDAATTVGDGAAATGKTTAARSRHEDREKTLEADNSALLKNTIEKATTRKGISDESGGGGFGALSKSSTVIHIPPATTTAAERKKEEKPSTLSSRRFEEDDSGAAKKKSELYNGSGESYLSRYKARNERDTSNRYKDTQELIESLKGPQQSAKSHYNHYGHYDAAGDGDAGGSSSYYKSRYDPETVAGYGAAGEKGSGGGGGASSLSRRTKSYRTRKEASRERKHLTMKLSAVNMDIDSPTPPPAASTKTAAAAASGRTYKQYGAKKSAGTGAYQRSQTQKLLYDFGDNDIYHPPTQRDNKRKEIQNVLRKYAQYDDEDMRRNKTNPYATANPMKSATSANLAYQSGGGAGVGGSSGSHLYSDRRDPIADHYGLGSSYYPRSHYGYDYPSYGSALSTRQQNPYAGASTSSSALNPYNPLSKTHSSAAVFNSGYLGGGSSAMQSSAAAAAAQRSRRNLMAFVREDLAFLVLMFLCGKVTMLLICFDGTNGGGVGGERDLVLVLALMKIERSCRGDLEAREEPWHRDIF